MATVTRAEVEATIGRPLTWWEEIGFFMESLTAKVEGRGLAEYQDAAFYGQMPATGDVADFLAGTDIGGLGASFGEMTITTAEQTAKGNLKYIIGGGLLVVLIAYLWGKLS